jgi:cyclic pyranopterin phosphate synthase
MRDSLGRSIAYLRLSLTSACPMRCLYCRPGHQAPDRSIALIRPDEIETLVRHLVRHHGLTKVRLTGGEPTARADLVEIIERLSSVDGLADLAMTTNGLTLASHARLYHNAGLGRVNISLDSLDSAAFARITGIDGLDRVLRGIDSAIQAGLKPIRLNTVVVAGANEHELPALLRFAGARGLEIRFIELMPMGPLADQWPRRYVPESQMRRLLQEGTLTWDPLEQGHDSARRFRVALDDGSVATVGFITPMSCNFCASCNRLRLTADGRIHPCLMDQARGSFLPAIRPRFDAGQFDRILGESLAAKAHEHPPIGLTLMSSIGG